jgi:thiol-disulfide isomerase/thioredoxin
MAIALLLVLLMIPATSSADEGVFANEISFQDLSGETVALESLLAEGPVILDFWATWCGPCKLAMPAWSKLADEYAEHGVRLVPVSWDHERMYPRITSWFDQQGFEFTSLVDPGKVAGRALGVVSLPTTYLIGADGRVLFSHVGYAQGDERLLESELRKVLDLGDD